MGTWKHKVGEEITAEVTAVTGGKTGLKGGEKHLVRFRVAELVAAGGADQHSDRYEVIKTGKGALLFFDPRGSYTEFASIEEIRESLDIGSHSKRELFAALGGDLSKLIPEI
jgi:hypothetical protein